MKDFEYYAKDIDFIMLQEGAIEALLVVFGGLGLNVQHSVVVIAGTLLEGNLEIGKGQLSTFLKFKISKIA